MFFVFLGETDFNLSNYSGVCLGGLVSLSFTSTDFLGITKVKLVWKGLQEASGGMMEKVILMSYDSMKQASKQEGSSYGE